MDSIIDNIILRIEWLNLEDASTLTMFIDKIEDKIINLENTIPDEIDDDWFSQPQNRPLSYKLKMFRKVKRILYKLLEESNDDSQRPEAIDSEDIEEIDESSYNPNNL